MQHLWRIWRFFKPTNKATQQHVWMNTPKPGSGSVLPLHHRHTYHTVSNYDYGSNNASLLHPMPPSVALYSSKEATAIARGVVVFFLDHEYHFSATPSVEIFNVSTRTHWFWGSNVNVRVTSKTSQSSTFHLIIVTKFHTNGPYFMSENQEEGSLGLPCTYYAMVHCSRTERWTLEWECFIYLKFNPRLDQFVVMWQGGNSDLAMITRS